MNNKDVAELYKIVSIGTKVVIVDGEYGAFANGFRYLKSGMYGSDVYEIQKLLKKQGFFILEPNGKFGSETENAIRKYCKAHNLYERTTINEDLQKKMGFILMD